MEALGSLALVCLSGQWQSTGPSGQWGYAVCDWYDGTIHCGGSQHMCLWTAGQKKCAVFHHCILHTVAVLTLASPLHIQELLTSLTALPPTPPSRHQLGMSNGRHR